MGHLNTVLGPIDESQVGHTMSHVHLTINLMCWHMPPESGPMHGLSETKITLDNLGTVRRNAMRAKDNLVQDDLALATREAARISLCRRHHDDQLRPARHRARYRRAAKNLPSHRYQCCRLDRM